jgi:aminoglycoside phosphotransferase (APT) family kinase protein
VIIKSLSQAAGFATVTDALHRAVGARADSLGRPARVVEWLAGESGHDRLERRIYPSASMHAIADDTAALLASAS